MIYTYRYALLGTDGRVSRETEKIDATNWLEYLKQNTTRYGNLHEFVQTSFDALTTENPLISASIAMQIDDIFRDGEPTLVSQYALFCWESFKAGKISPGAWGAALAYAWQSGAQTMLDSVLLKEELVIRMFESADKEALFRVGASQKGWDDYYAALPESLTLYRGISTASKHAERGFGWTLLPEEAKKFAGRHVRTARDIPGVIQAQVPKAAVLAVFEPGKEFVIHPGVAKQALVSNFLSGPGLVKFRQNWKQWKAGENERLARLRNLPG